MGDRRLAVWPSTRTTCILRWALSSRSDIDLAFRIVLFVMQFGSRKDLQTWCYNLETFGFFTVDESLAVVGDRGNGEEGNKRKVIGKISKNGKRKIKIQQKNMEHHFKKRVSITTISIGMMAWQKRTTTKRRDLGLWLVVGERNGRLGWNGRKNLMCRCFFFFFSILLCVSLW